MRAGGESDQMVQMQTGAYAAVQFSGWGKRPRVDRGASSAGSSKPPVSPPRTLTEDEFSSLLESQRKNNRFRKWMQVLLLSAGIGVPAAWGIQQFSRVSDRAYGESQFLHQPGSISHARHAELQTALAQSQNQPSMAMFEHLKTLTAYASPLVVGVEVVREGGDVYGTVGSGFLYEGRYVVTNEHVSSYAQKKSRGLGGQVRIRLLDGRTVSGHIIHSDKRRDIAVLAIDPGAVGMRELPSAKIATTPLSPGEAVLAIGHPMGEQWSATFGIVSSTNRHQFQRDRRMIQIDAAINGGNSGGPSFNMQGQVVGMNSEKLDVDNIAYMISAEDLESEVKQAIARYEKDEGQSSR